MADSIHLHPVETAGEDPRRLNAFPGRHLGEREFDLLQDYVDDRLAPLLADRPPGVVDGLELDVTGAGADTRLHLRPGAGLGAGGRAVRLFFPLDQSWASLVEIHRREHDAPPRDGFHFVTLRRGVEVVDADADRDPCRRTEPDPVRDSRIETVGRLGLQFITANPRWMAMDRSRAVNRLCVRHLRQSPFDAATGAVPVALVRVAEGMPSWFDVPGGRIPARADGPYHAFLAHAREAMQGLDMAGGRRPALPRPRLPAGALRPVGVATPIGGLVRPGRPGGLVDIATPGVGRPPGATPPAPPAAEPATPDQLLGLDYLPAAGPLPPSLVTDIASPQPRLAFRGGRLQVELMPAPASTVPALLQRELPRGVVDLVHGHQDRIRILAAIPDPDYRPDLMDLPRIDGHLAQEMYRRGRRARAAHARWLTLWQALFAGLDADALEAAGAPPVADPADPGAAPPGAVAEPPSPEQRFQDLVAQRRAEPGGDPLPEPYASHDGASPPPPPDLPDAVTMPEAGEDGLLRRRERLRGEIDALEEELEANFNLLGEMGDYLKLQRQQLDAITVSFSALAGGVPGDGSGLKLVRWSNAAVFRPSGQEEA